MKRKLLFYIIAVALVLLSVKGFAKRTPSITVSGSLSALSTTYGTASSTTSFTVRGSGMNAGITVTAPVGFEVSIDGTNFSPSLTFGGSGTISTTMVYVRLAASAPVGTYSGNVSCSSSGATTKTRATASSTVSAASLTITANAVSKVYGTTLTGASGSIAFASSGLQNGETIGSVTIAYGTGSAANAAVGTYTGSVNASAATGGTFTPSNYSITYIGADITITQAPLTITAGSISKVYGTALISGSGSTAFSSSGLKNGETIGTVTIAYGSAGPATAAVGTYTGAAIASGATGGTFTASNYSITYLAGNVTVTKAALTITANSISKVYGTALTSGSGSTAFTASGLQNGETAGSVTMTYGTGALATAAVGTYTGTSVASAAAGGTFTAANYTITYVKGNIIVTAKALTITGLTANNKIYDKTTTATLSGTAALNGVVGSDVVTLGGTPSATFVGTNVGTGISVTVAGYTISGASASNYTLTQPAGLTANITAKVVTEGGATANSKTYDGTTIATVSGGTLTGVISPDVVSISTTGTFASAGVGNGINVTISLTGANAGNYILTQPGITANITPAPLTITANSVSKVYSNTLTGGSGSTAFTSSGLQNGETIGSVTIAYGTGSAAADPIATYAGAVIASAATGGTFTASNYAITYTSGNITVVAPTINYTGSPYTYYAGTPISNLTPAVTGIPSSYSISPALPAGLSIDTSTGVISGTPTVTTAAVVYTITANYIGSVTATTTINIIVLAPSINYTGSPYTYYAGIAIPSLTPSVTGIPTSYSVSPALPSGLSLNSGTGLISGVATIVSASAAYTVTANYAAGITATTTINITVLPPTITYAGSPYTYYAGIPISSLTPTVTGTPSGYSVSPALPSGLSIDSGTGVISGTATAAAAASTYTVTANYASGVTASTTINITVLAQAISYSGSPYTYYAGTAISALTPTATNTPSGYSISPALPAGLSMSASTGVISGTPSVTAAATTYTITASYAAGVIASTNIIIKVLAPTISYTGSPFIYTTGTAITTLSPAVKGSPVSFSGALPPGLTINSVNGHISGTPTTISTATVYTITANYAAGVTATTTINITVNPPAPIVSYTPSTNIYTVGQAITPLTPTNAGGTVTSYLIGPSLPAGLSFNTTTGIISGTPTAVSPVTAYTISATNAGGISTTTITLSCVLPAAPVISYSPSTNVYTVGTAIASLTPINTGGAAASYSIGSSLPAGLSFDTTTGVISGTPTVVSSTTTYTITATNAGGSGSTTVTITVNPAAPIISYTPSTNIYTQGTPISALSPVNTGGPATSYSIGPALPAGLSFNTTTGVITGTPTATSSVTNYIVTATNAGGTGNATITLSVNNLAPNIVFSPSTVSYPVGGTVTPAIPVNTGYYGVPITYSISASLPAGLSFDSATGGISGTPTAVFPTTTFYVTATNVYGSSTAFLIITVNPAAPIISYTPSTNNYPVGAAISTLAPTNTGGAVTGYSYSSTGTSLTGASLSGPSLMTIDGSGNIYVANFSNKTISKWNSSRTYLGTFGTGISMSSPEGIVFDSAGNAYVEDTGSGDVYKFNSAGVYQSTILTGLGHPLGICINSSDDLYIATYNTSTLVSSVIEYTTSGTVIATLPNTNMNEADGVAVDGSGNVFVLNRGNNLSGTDMGNVTEYSSSGAYLGVFSSGYNDPLAISVDPSGNVFVADSHNDEVKIYSPTGVLLNTLTGFNDVEGFVADNNGNLYVSDFTNKTVKEFLALGGYHINAPLPSGLSFDSSTGQITGTPTAVFPTTTYTITAYNITGSGTTTVTLSCYDSYDWIGATSTNWNTATNWLSGIVPTSANQALIGVNRTFSYFPNIPASSGTVSVGSIAFGNLGGKAPGVVVNSGSTLNVLGAITYQSDASSGLGYSCTLSGAGTLNASSINVISNTNLSSSYTGIFISSVANLNVTANIALTSSNSGSALFNSTFKLTGGTMLLSGILQTTNTSTSTSSFIVVPTTTATLQLAGAAALSGLSATGTNVVTFKNTGATVQYSGGAQTVYTSTGITGLSAGVSYQNISFSGTGIKTASSGNLNIAGDFTNTLTNDAADYISLSSPTVNFNGTTQNLAGGGGNGTTLYNVTFSGAGTKTMTSGNFYVAPLGILTMTGNSTSTILAANGLLTLNSNATGSATVAAIPDGPTITGNVNVQRYITGGAGYRNYRLASSPVYASTVGSNNVYSINYLQNSIYLTGNAGGGFDKDGNPTLYLYREDLTPSNATFTSGNFWGISAINNTPSYSYYLNGGSTSYNIPVGDGMMFFFRGNRASAPLLTETDPSYTTPVAVTLSTTGILNQGQVTVSDWYTPTSPYLGYTGSGTGTNYAVRGFNLVGNPYASTIDWEQYNTTSTTSGIYANNVGKTIYELNPVTNNYDVYQVGGAYTNHGTRTILSGQGFFVLATSSTNPQLIFNETAKITAQNTGLYLFMSSKANMIGLSSTNITPHLRLQMELDSVNTDDTYIGFMSGASAQYNTDEDAPYKAGNGKVELASFSSDSVRLAINKMPLPGLKQTVIPLFVTARAYGLYKLNMTELDAIPQIYEVWLMDKYNKDSLDMRHNTTYAFNITTDTNTYGSNRFQLVLRQNQQLAVHLLNFTGIKAAQGAQIAWLTENEENYTNFTVERSTDGGITFTVLGGVPSSALGTYSFLDKTPPDSTDMYRLKIEDLNGTISYSNIVTLVYGNSPVAAGNIVVYPNPVGSVINLSINKAGVNSVTGLSGGQTGPSGPGLNQSPQSYDIKIINITGSVIKTATSSSPTWQGSVSNLSPGAYIIMVANNDDGSVVGKTTFVKL